jgi:hypothetical protein
MLTPTKCRRNDKYVQNLPTTNSYIATKAIIMHIIQEVTSLQDENKIHNTIQNATGIIKF